MTIEKARQERSVSEDMGVKEWDGDIKWRIWRTRDEKVKQKESEDMEEKEWEGRLIIEDMKYKRWVKRSEIRK